MSLFRRQARAQAQPNADRDLLDDLLLVRIVCAGGATRPQLVRDLGPLFANKLSPAEWRVRTETALARLANGTHLRENRGRYRISEEGAQVVASFLGEKEARARAWSEQRDLWLVAKALSVDATKPSLRKALTRPEGLSALIVQQAFGLSLREALSPSKLRTALALVAQERAGENGKAPRKTSPLSTEDSRKLAAQLLQSPRDFSTDARLIAALSAEQVGAARPEIEVLRLGLLRRLATPYAELRREVPSPTRARHVSAKGLQRPGLAQFSAGVLTAARSHAEGWPGSRKAFISQVWEAIRTSHPEWGLSEIEFKDMLAGAHRAGQLVLASADLKNKRDIKEFEDSAILYKNTVWHFVRVED
jgi:hypothetical protein